MGFKGRDFRVPPAHLSYSQVASYSECGERYRLERMGGVTSSTWWTTLGGTAAHEATAKWDRLEALGLEPDVSECIDWWHEEFATAIATAERRSQEVKASGKTLESMSESSGGPNKKDRAWVEHFFPVFVERWLRWRREHGWRVASLDGVPGVEVDFRVELTDPASGQVFPLIGSVDRVFTRFGRKGATVVDLKFGKVPDASLQLAAYAVGLREQYGVEVGDGCFWAPSLGATGRGKSRHASPSGGTSKPVSLRAWTAEGLGAAFGNARRGIDAGVFPASPSALCRGCGVRDLCWAWSGPEGAERAREHLDRAVEAGRRLPISEGE